MFNNNQHLNIFEHYSQANALPIGNNISRGLAIILSENPLVFDRFIGYINSNCSVGMRSAHFLRPCMPAAGSAYH